MTAKVDISKLGARKVRKSVVRARQNPNTGLNEMIPVWELVDEIHSLLTTEEAATLPDSVEWQETTIKGAGKYMCSCEGRRFFVDELPKKSAPEKSAPKKEKDNATK